MPVDLLQLATTYQLKDLVGACTEVLLSRLTAENAVTTLVNFDRYLAGNTEVKKEVIGYIKKNAISVVRSENWKLFVNNYGDLVTEIFEAMAS